MLDLSLDQGRNLLLSQVGLGQGLQVCAFRRLSSDAAQVQVAAREPLDTVRVKWSVWWTVGLAEVATTVVSKVLWRKHVALGSLKGRIETVACAPEVVGLGPFTGRRVLVRDGLGTPVEGEASGLLLVLLLL